jgi:hypothetical protein
MVLMSTTEIVAVAAVPFPFDEAVFGPSRPAKRGMTRAACKKAASVM